MNSAAQPSTKLGTPSLFELRSGNHTVDAFCSGKPGNCWQLVEKIGQVIWMEDERISGGLLKYGSARKPSSEDVTLVVTKIKAK